MLVTFATLVLVAVTISFIYYLGMVQGKFVERARVRKRFRKQEWMLAQALNHWSPWSTSIEESRARLAAEYEEWTE